MIGRIRPTEWVVYGLVLVLECTGVVLSFTSPDFFEYTYVAEDGLIEWLTVLSLVSIMLLCFYRVIALRKTQTKLFLAITFLTGLVFLFGAGEEISWGQRIIGIESSEFFQEHNAQSETNLHNMVVGGTKVNKILFSKILGILVILYLFVLSPMYLFSDTVRDWIARLAIPIPWPHHVIAFITVVIISELADSTSKGELLELSACSVILMIMAFPRNGQIYQRKPEPDPSP